MKKQDYSVTIEVAMPPEEVFTHINAVSKWLTKSAEEASSGRRTEFEGESTKLNDEFIIRSGENHYSKQKLMEFIPERKVVWLVTESKLNWIEKNEEEWTNTKMVFEISSANDKTMLHFTHEGLIPDLECYSMCTRGWDMFIKERLFNLITNAIITV